MPHKYGPALELLLCLALLLLAMSGSANGKKSPSSRHDAEGHRSGRGVVQKRRRHVAADGSVRELDPVTHTWILVDLESDGTARASRDESPLLALEGRRFDMDFALGEFHILGTPVVVLPPAMTRDSQKQVDGDTGRTVWDASVVLSKFLEHTSLTSSDFKLTGKRIIELGAGTGLAGLSAAVLGAHVVISDLRYCLADIKRNLEATNVPSPGSAIVRELDWLKPDAFFDNEMNGQFDFVLAADVVWLDHLVTPLVSLLKMLLHRHADLQFVFAHQTRSEQTDVIFFGQLQKVFHVRQIPDTSLPQGFRASKVKIFIATQRKHH